MPAIYFLAVLLGFLLLLVLLFGLAILVSGKENTNLDTIIMIVTAVVGLLATLAFRWVLVTILATPNIKEEIGNYILYATVAVTVSYPIFIATNFLNPKGKISIFMTFVMAFFLVAFGVARVISFYLG